MARQREWRKTICSGALAVARSIQDLGGDIGERDLAGEDAEFSAGSRHAIDSATGFVLTDGEAALQVNGVHPLGAVVAHAGDRKSVV